MSLKLSIQLRNENVYDDSKVLEHTREGADGIPSETGHEEDFRHPKSVFSGAIKHPHLDPSLNPLPLIILLSSINFILPTHITMASSIQEHYANRKTNNVYNSLTELITSAGVSFLTNCEYNKDFFKKTSWRGLDFQAKDGSEFRVNIFGEIQPESLGTKHSALGDFYIGKKEKVWSRVKFVLFEVDVLFMFAPQPAYLCYSRVEHQGQVRSWCTIGVHSEAFYDVSRSACRAE